MFSKWIYAMVATVVAQQHTLLQLGWNLQDLQRSLHEGLKIKAVAIRGDSVASPVILKRPDVAWYGLINDDKLWM